MDSDIGSAMDWDTDMDTALDTYVWFSSCPVNIKINQRTA